MKKKPKKEHKKNYGQVDNPDSLWQRANSARKVQGKNPNTGMGGKEIMQMLGIEDDGAENINDRKPLKMMDIVLQTWEGEDKDRENYDEYDPEEDYEIEDEEEEEDE